MTAHRADRTLQPFPLSSFCLHPRVPLRGSVEACPGVLPGLTLVMGVALALPFTYQLDVTPSIVLLTAMYVSGTYGGAFTAIQYATGSPIRKHSTVPAMPTHSVFWNVAKNVGLNTSA